MKSIMMAIALLISFNLQAGEERVNRTKLNFETSSAVLTKAMGWMYNSELGEWIGYSNTISDDKSFKEKYSSLLGSDYMMSHASENFRKIQSKSVIFKSKRYYVLIVTKWSGFYEYPSIDEGWTTYTNTSGYIFPESDYKKLLTIKGRLSIKTQLNVSISVDKFNKGKFLALIQNKLAEKIDEYDLTYTFSIMKTKKGSIRFILPTLGLVDEGLEKAYFETSQDNFFKILSNIKR